MDILDAVRILRPGTCWNLRGDRLEQANDDSPRVDPPTWEEIQAVLNKHSYKELRRSAYPSIGDQLDALWKGGDALADMQAKIMAVKAQFPKPE